MKENYLADKERLEAALDKHAKREVSLSKAAKLSQIPVADFMVMAAERKIPINYSLKSLEEDFRVVMGMQINN